MTDDDKRRFAQIMAGMAETFGASISSAGLSVRFEALKEYAIEQVESACVACIRSHRYTNVPTVAEIIDHISGGNVDDIAMVESAKVWQAVCDHGAYRDVVFDSATTQAVIEYGFGGWVKLCRELMSDQQKWFYKEFSAMFAAYSRQGVRRGGVLSGICAHASPVLIGDKRKAAEVMGEKTARIGMVHATECAAVLLAAGDADGKGA